MCFSISSSLGLYTDFFNGTLENLSNIGSIWAQFKHYLWGIWPLRMLDRKWRDLSPYFFSRIFLYLFSRTFPPYFFLVICFP